MIRLYEHAERFTHKSYELEVNSREMRSEIGGSEYDMVGDIDLFSAGSRPAREDSVPERPRSEPSPGI